MASHEVALTGREDIATGTMAFHFVKPTGFSFKPGQAVDIALHDDSHRLFSLVSAPFEEGLTVATRMRHGSAFKRALGTLPLGAKLKLKGPQGVMTLHEDRARPAVFIAGGIGITPFMSMLRQAAYGRLAQRLFLLYANRRSEDAAFLAELQGLARRNPGLRVLARMTERDGILDEETVKRFVGDAASPVYYLAGPPGMVEAMSAILKSAGVGDDDVRSEEFYGY
jgi:ferredoxin-NADP reductase